MEHYQHPACNTVLMPAPGTESSVDPLYTQRCVDKNGPYVCSYWRPNAEELAMLQAGHSVVLMIHGHTHPPVYVGVTE